MKDDICFKIKELYSQDSAILITNHINEKEILTGYYSNGIKFSIPVTKILEIKELSNEKIRIINKNKGGF